MLEQAAKADADEGGEPMELLLADVRHLPFADGVISGIHAGAALHLWPDLPACASEIARVLRPGGRFVGTTFVHASRRGLQYGLEWAFEKTTRTRVFKMEELEKLMTDAGLVNVQTERWGGFVLICAEYPGG
jgi:ubiquinone/menaquinone biosynthesis C-methylase UbiE